MLMKCSWLSGVNRKSEYLNFRNAELFLHLIIRCVSLKVGRWYWLQRLINISVTTYVSCISGKPRPSHQANFMCIKLRYVLCQHFRHNLRPTFRRNFQKVLQTVLQYVLQAEPEIKYHALSTSILNITGYNFILLPDIYPVRLIIQCSIQYS